MIEELDYDFINYLADKWYNYLLKKDPHDLVRKKQYMEVQEMIGQMKLGTESGKMLYSFLSRLHSQADEELEAYKKYLEGGPI